MSGEFSWIQCQAVGSIRRVPVVHKLGAYPHLSKYYMQTAIFVGAVGGGCLVVNWRIQGISKGFPVDYIEGEIFLAELCALREHKVLYKLKCFDLRPMIKFCPCLAKHAKQMTWYWARTKLSAWKTTTGKQTWWCRVRPCPSKRSHVSQSVLCWLRNKVTAELCNTEVVLKVDQTAGSLVARLNRRDL